MLRLAVLLLACAALVSCQMGRNAIPGSRPAPPATMKPAMPGGLDRATLMQIAQMVAQIIQQQNLMGSSGPYGGGPYYNPPDPPDMPDYIKRQRQAAYYGGRPW